MIISHLRDTSYYYFVNAKQKHYVLNFNTRKPNPKFKKLQKVTDGY